MHFAFSAVHVFGTLSARKLVITQTVCVCAEGGWTFFNRDIAERFQVWRNLAIAELPKKTHS